MAKRSAKKSRFYSATALILLALLMAVVGTIATRMSWQTAAKSDAMKSWVEVPATIRHVELKVDVRTDHGYHGRDQFRIRTKRTYTLIAAYEYEFGGLRYTGDRVSVHGNSNTGDNVSRFLSDAHWELRQHRDLGMPFRCYVNSQRPGESVLYRELRWQMAAAYTLFATVFGAIGFGILAAILASTWRRLRRRSVRVPDERASGGTAIPVLAVLVVWWMTASLPLVTRLPEVFMSASSPFVVVTLIFPAVGVVLFLAFVYQIICRFTRRSGCA
jgi:hypothetical protein